MSRRFVPSLPYRFTGEHYGRLLNAAFDLSFNLHLADDDCNAESRYFRLPSDLMCLFAPRVSLRWAESRAAGRYGDKSALTYVSLYYDDLSVRAWDSRPLYYFFWLSFYLSQEMMF